VDVRAGKIAAPEHSNQAGAKLVEDYLSERQQIDQVRVWLKENAPWAVTGILIGVGALYGWQQFQAWREHQALTGGEKYSQTLEALARNDRDAATRLAGQLQQDYGRTPYADLAALALARYHVDAGRFADAAKSLETVMQGSRDDELRLVARLRLARVQRADGKPDLALATLAGATPGAAAAAFAEVRGDVLLDKGDRSGALAAFKEALAANTAGVVDKELLQLKVASISDAAPGAPPAAAGAAVPARAAAAGAGNKQ
jgi:predicted negative regulator of RcsB-dependent stress response